MTTHCNIVPTLRVSHLHVVFLIFLLVLAATQCSGQQDSLADLMDDDLRDPSLLSVPFGVLDLQIRSQSGSELNDFLFNILAETSAFLDEQILASSNQLFHAGVLFSHVTLNVDWYELVETPTINVNTSAATEDKVLSYGRNFDASVSLQGMSYFDGTGKKPWRKEAPNAVRTVLQSHSQDLDRRLKSTSNPLLQELRFVIVTLNGETIVGRNLTNIFAGSQPRGTPDSLANMTSDDRTLPTWAMALMTGIASFMLVLALIYVVRHIRAAHLNGRRRLSVPKQKLTTDTEENEYDEDGDPETSPMHSDILSVASSAFTYNPAHLYGGNHNIKADAVANACNGSVPTKQNHSLLLFHNDISAISNKKDLSLIYEEPSEDASTGTSEQATPQSIARRRYINVESTLTTSTALDLSGPTQNVIDDLKDLSAQIDTYRRANKGIDFA